MATRRRFFPRQSGSPDSSASSTNPRPALPRRLARFERLEAREMLSGSTGPTVTSVTTTENVQASGLVIQPGAGQTSVAYFHIYGITGGTLYENNGTTPIANNSYITVAEGEAGLKFTPNANLLIPGGFTVGESTTAGASGSIGTTARDTVTVWLAGPSVASTTTVENTQTSIMK
ncbi:MAG TPA: hypothetical protein VMF30_18620, partial [Pirellulales bacterium]|nr:hypothetical protein [Pirellulales bacterium]